MKQKDDKTPGSADRRRALLLFILGLSAAGAAAIAAPIVGLLLWPLRRRAADEWYPIGRVRDFAVGATVKVIYQESGHLPYSGLLGQSAAFVRRQEERGFVAFSIYCTHTGCPVRWVEGAQLFLCPCHGGAFHSDGSVAAGPPPVPLMRHEVRVRDDLVELRARPVQLRGLKPRAGA